MTAKTLSERLNWRYATKKMDPAKTVPDAEVEAIVEAIRMAPTSSGVQPFELLLVTNPDVRSQLREAAYGQSPITDGSHLLVFAAWDDYTEARLDEVVALMKEARGDLAAIDDHYNAVKGKFLACDAAVNHAHAARQTYLALGFAMMAAAELGVDTTPMEGFDPEGVDRVLGLDARGLRSVALLALGYRDPSGDWLLPMKKVRKPVETLVTFIDRVDAGRPLQEDDCE